MDTTKKCFRIIIIFTILIFITCIKKPGPISVVNLVTPSVMTSGNYGYWEIKVTNPGSKVTISRIHCREEVISGWAAGQYAEADLPFTNSEISAGETEVAYSKTFQGINTGSNDIVFMNTVTVYSNGGTATDVVTYTVQIDKYSKSNSIVIFKSLLINNND